MSVDFEKGFLGSDEEYRAVRDGRVVDFVKFADGVLASMGPSVNRARCVIVNRIDSLQRTERALRDSIADLKRDREERVSRLTMENADLKAQIGIIRADNVSRVEMLDERIAALNRYSTAVSREYSDYAATKILPLMHDSNELREAKAAPLRFFVRCIINRIINFQVWSHFGY